ncbi:hypothetical protein RFI_19254, partial [Reticulomyxa filosa]
MLRVGVVWCPKETLSTIKVSNVSSLYLYTKCMYVYTNVITSKSGSSEEELRGCFGEYGEIVDMRFGKEVQKDGKLNGKRKANTKLIAWISFAQIDQALNACREMRNSVISCANDDSGLCVQLINPDSR